MNEICITVDARHLSCPLPVLRARKALIGLKAGDVICVLATDNNALHDFPLFCAEAGHDLVEIKTDGDVHTITVRKGQS